MTQFSILLKDDLMNNRFQILAVITSILFTFQTATAQEWTRFHGPNGQGVASLQSFPAQWNKDNIVFKAELPGIGHSSPVVWGEKVFVLSANPDTAERFVLCIEANSGKILWQHDYKSVTHKLHLRSSYASCTPVVDKDVVIFAWSDPQHTLVKAFSHDGNELWTKDLGSWSSQHGFGTSPVIYKNKILLNASQANGRLPEGIEPGESFFYAFDKESGEIIWKTPRGTASSSYSVPAIYQGEDGDEIICSNTVDGMYSLHPETGEENWSVKAFDKRTVSSPLFAGGHIFGSTGSGGGGNYVAAIKPGKDPAVSFKLDRSAPYVPTSVCLDDLMFCFYDKGILSCMNTKTGEVHYQKRLDCAFSGSPIRVGDKLFCVDEEGIVHVIAASKEFKILAKNPLGEASRSTPAVSGGRMFIRTYSQLICVGINKS